MKKAEALERSVMITHALLGLPEGVDILTINSDDKKTKILLSAFGGATVPEEDDREFNHCFAFVWHYRAVDDNIDLVWGTPIVSETGDCSTCGKDCLYCDDECRRDAE